MFGLSTIASFFKRPRKVDDPVTQKYREFRIREIAEATHKSYEDAEALADRWIIHMASVRIDASEPEIQFIPSPVWDDEWMLSRNGFDTREEALAEVRRVGGKLLTDV